MSHQQSKFPKTQAMNILKRILHLDLNPCKHISNKKFSIGYITEIIWLLTEARKTLAAAIKSSVFPPVQDPMYTLSIFTSLHSLAKARLSGECGCKDILTSLLIQEKRQMQQNCQELQQRRTVFGR